MGSLKHASSPKSFTLRGRTLVGRSSRADLKLSGDRTSSEHATIFWTGAHWVLRDLKSRNGTRVNQMLVSGRDCPLSVGDEILFGDPNERWLWADAAAPEPSATREDGAVVLAQNGILFLPDHESPQATVHERDGKWELDASGAIREVKDAESISVGRHQFTLSLPEIEPEYARTHTLVASMRVAAARVKFKVSLDEEHVQVSFAANDVQKQLSARAINYLLLELARARSEDQSANLPEDDAGWIYTDALAERLGVAPEAINVDVYRLRHALAKLQMFSDPEEVIQRRRSTAQLRLGCPGIEIEQAGRSELSKRGSRKPRAR
ncbi:MAG TPA: FHA domain-containing protein [Polyangiaceae bacterium]|nr:FHA domain-containing protein [Polyangiaceae bacterium]